MTAQAEPELVLVQRVPVAVLREQVPMPALTAFFDRAFDQVTDVLADQRVGMVGPPVAIYHGSPTDVVDVAVGFPVARPVAPERGVVSETLPGGMVARVLHVGPYDRLSETYARLQAWVGGQQLALGPLAWESYLTKPSPEDDPHAMVTEVTWQVLG